ncbi:MAG: SIR2 family protein [Gemmatimonadetes bacterium]|nr:SIR2 family protein [Gemmatimonadota bacterium]
MDFQAALPRLAAAYDQGLLVPFLGAGMSRPACPDWVGLIQGLEAAGGIDPSAGGTGAQDLVRRGNRAVRALRRRNDDAFIAAMRRTLYAQKAGAPPQTEALARLWWPLVLSTNYDDLFVRAYRKYHPASLDAVTVLGRSAQDCQQVLSSLSSPSGCCLWALQGHLKHSGDEALQAQLVVGHEEYRRVTHTAQHFRRAFAEVFRRRSLLFLGSSLADTYLLDLFGEILEFSGANPMPHYAIVQQGTVDAPFLRSRFNIIALQYEDHAELPGWLDALKFETERARARPARWAYTIGYSALKEIPSGTDDLEIIRGQLTEPGPGEVVAVSAGTGRGGSLWVSKAIYELVKPHWPTTLAGRGFMMEALSPRFVFGYRTADGSGPVPIVAVNARVDHHDRRDLRLIGEAVGELLDWAAANGFSCVRMQVLASGRTAHYPARFSLAEAIRAYGRWRRRTPSAVALKVHVVDPGALLEVTTGRLDPGELMTCDDVRFWVEVVDAGQVLEREMVFGGCEDPVGDLASRFDVPGAGWEMEVNPRPRADSKTCAVQAAWNDDLLSVGVIQGATVRFIAPR